MTSLGVSEGVVDAVMGVSGLLGESLASLGVSGGTVCAILWVSGLLGDEVLVGKLVRSLKFLLRLVTTALNSSNLLLILLILILSDPVLLGPLTGYCATQLWRWQ